MKLTTFINEFSKTHRIAHIDDITSETIKAPICEDIYLVNTEGVTECK